MDILTSGPGLAALAALCTVLILMLLREKLRDLRETPTVALVRKRRELAAKLHEIAGDDDVDLLRSEARRLRASPANIEVLEAAIDRAEKISANASIQRRLA